MKTALIILDGLGLSADIPTNPVFSTNTPFLDLILTQYPHIVIDAAGQSVGLPFGEPGNSEIGHYNLGTGELNWQTQELINQAIKDKTFFKNQVLKKTFEHVKTNKSKLHLLGLVSNGGVHSQLNHLIALLEFAKKENLDKDQVFIHGFCDGRDTQPKVATKFFNELEKEFKKLQIGQIATLSGRYYAMDRDNNWGRTSLVYRALTEGRGQIAQTAQEAIGLAYERGETDEFIKPTIIENQNHQPVATINPNDAIIIFNYRADRVRQLVKIFLSSDPNLPNRKIVVPLVFTTMTPYETDWKLSISPATIQNGKINIVFHPVPPNITLSNLLAQNKLTQLHLAETEKYAHVTYFFNGGTEKTNPGEKFSIVASPKITSYDQKPQMSTAEININLKQELISNQPDFILINYANCDMVGHTGNFEAIKKAINAVDFYLKDLISFLILNGYLIFVTADHGNAEQAINPVTKQIDKEHSINPVFFLKIDPKEYSQKPTYINHQSLWIKLSNELKKGILADVTSTIANYLGVKSDLFSGQKIL